VSRGWRGAGRGGGEEGSMPASQTRWCQPARYQLCRG
jgi:hypothetical protein